MTAARSRELCIMACVFCKDAAFHSWLGVIAEEQGLGPSAGERLYEDGIDEGFAKVFILEACRINSRNELDTNPDAAARFHELVRLPFLAWKAEQEGVV